MDLIKIGKYISEKRKALGLTQKQLAEKIGMSDKSVSKWERGVCLPDVSVYLELCEILGIHINEFLAGEDLKEEHMIKQSEDNLLQVAKESKDRQKHLKKIVLALAACILFSVILLGIALARIPRRPQNYIEAFSRDSAEMKTAELLSETDGTLLFRYSADEGLKEFTLFTYQYRSGKLEKKETAVHLSYEEASDPTQGILALVPDYKNFTVKIIVTDHSAKYSTEISLLEDVENRAYLARSWVQIEERTPIQYNTEQGFAALIYDENEISALPIHQIAANEHGTGNDYVWYFSLQFGTE